MRNVVNTYVEKFRQSRQTRRRVLSILAVLALVVCVGVFWELHSDGVAMANETYCGMEEHQHDKDCYETVLVCGEEEAEGTDESEGHTHDESCYEEVLVCDIPEHVHTIECMTDETADVETAADWEATIPEELSGNWADDVVAVAQSQIGYAESAKNFQLAEDGETHQGYTRYGAWYGNAYGDWDAMFVSFCLNYAGVPEDEFPEASGASAWITELNKKDLYADAADYEAVPGDIIFFDEDEDGKADRAGIVTDVKTDTLTVVEGDSDDAVCENKYEPDDEQIIGYGIMPGTEQVYTAKSNGVSVTVYAPEGALPDDAELSVKLINENSEEYAEAAEAIGMDVMTLSAGDGTEKGLAVLDISFQLDGKEVEPEEPVQVTLDISAIVPEDTGTITVQHLVETKNGLEPEVVAKVSADDPIAEFEVESFSVFTVEWNDGTEATIEVHVYNMNGTSINETLDEDSSLIADNGSIQISDLVDHLEANTEYIGEYTFQYATVYYEVAQTQGASYDPYTIGSQTASVTQISKSGTTYTVSYGTNQDTTVSSPYKIEIHLYYSIPTVTISATNEHSNDTVSLTAENEYFQGLEASDSSVTYSWSLSNDSMGSITPGQPTATFTWSDSAQSGDQVTITVIMTNTYTDESENKVIETASDTYTLTYGEVAVTVTVTAASGTGGQANAHVALVDSNGSTVATGTTGSDGTVTLYAVPGTYTVGVTYVYQSSTTGGDATTRYTTEGEVTLGSGGTTTTVSLANVTAIVSGPGGDTSGSYAGGTEPYYYEHIDVKVAAASTEDTSVTFSDLDAVYVYDKYGNLIYYSDDLVANENTTDYNCLFDINGAEDTHSIVVSSEDTIVIVYEVIENGVAKTYTLTMAGDGTYPVGEYYAYTDVNAYQLYNNLYGGNYASQAAFEEAWETGQVTGDGYNEAGIPIGGYSYSLVADYLCDTRTTSGQAGLDIVIDVEEAENTGFDFRIAKEFVEYTGTEEEISSVEFVFTLTELTETAVSESIWTVSEDTTVSVTTGTTESWTSGFDSNGNTVWSSLVEFEESKAIEAKEGTYNYYFVLSETPSDIAMADVQNYGIRVQASYSSATGQISLNVYYCELQVDENESGSETESVVYQQVNNETSLNLTYVTDDEDNVTNSYYALPFVNTYRSETYPVDIYKYTGDIVDPVWASTTATTGNPDATDTYYLRYSEIDENGDTVYYYAIGTGSGSLEEPFDVTEWTTDRGADGVISVNVPANAGETYYFTGVIGNTNVVFEFDHTDGTETDEYLTQVDDTGIYGTALSGAEFMISYTSGEEEYENTYYAVFTLDANSGSYVFNSWTENDYEATALTSGVDGYIHIESLPGGTYTLSETKAPDGYNMLDSVITFTIDENGSLSVNSANSSVITTDVGIALAVENIESGELPNTGGLGTWMFTLFGSMLVIGAAGLLYWNRRRGVIE